MNFIYYWFGSLVLLNLITFLLMGIDKKRAIHQKWRIPERTIWSLSIIGGALGSYAGMKFFRHKTKHAMFKYGLALLAFVQITIISSFFWW